MSLLVTEQNTVVLHKGEGPGVTFKGRSQLTFKLTGENTKNHFGLYEVEMQPNAMGATPHVHHQLTEIFYVLEGRLDLLSGEQRVIGHPGSLVSVPPTVVHAFANTTPQPVKLLLLFCPAEKREEYFREMYELTKDGRPPAPEVFQELDRRFDTTRVNVPFP